MAHEFPNLCAGIVIRAIVNAPSDEREERIALALANKNITEEQARELREMEAA